MGEKGNELVDDEDNDVGTSVCVLPLPHFACVVLDVCLLSE